MLLGSWGSRLELNEWLSTSNVGPIERAHRIERPRPSTDHRMKRLGPPSALVWRDSWDPDSGGSTAVTDDPVTKLSSDLRQTARRVSMVGHLARTVADTT